MEELQDIDAQIPPETPDLDRPPKKNPSFGAWKLTSTAPMLENLVDRNWEDESVLLGAAWNPMTFLKTLALLRNSEFKRVREAAIYRLNNLPKFIPAAPK